MEIYIILMLSIAIIGFVYIFAPFLKEAKGLGINNTFTRNPEASMLVTFAFLALMAPVTFAVLLLPDLREKCMLGISKVVLENDE